MAILILFVSHGFLLEYDEKYVFIGKHLLYIANEIERHWACALYGS